MKTDAAFITLNRHCTYAFVHKPVTFMLVAIIPKSKQVPGKTYIAYSDTEFSGWQLSRNDGWVWIMSEAAALSVLNEAFSKYYLVHVTDVNTYHTFTIQRPKAVS